MISMRMRILSYRIQQVIHNICTKVQNPRCSHSWESFDGKKFTHSQTLLWKRQKLYTLVYTLYVGDIIMNATTSGLLMAMRPSECLPAHALNSKREEHQMSGYTRYQCNPYFLQGLISVKFYGPDITVKVMSSLSVNLVTLFLGRLSPLSGLQYLCT